MNKQQKVYSLVPDDSNIVQINDFSKGWKMWGHGRDYDFEDFAELGAIATLIKEDFRQWFIVRRKNTVAARYGYLIFFLTWLAGSISGSYKIIDRRLFIDYGNFLEATTSSDNTNYLRYQALGNVANRLMQGNDIEQFEYPPRFDGRRRELGYLKTLVELLPMTAKVVRNSKLMLKSLLEYCWEEIEESVENYRTGLRWMRGIHSEEDAAVADIVKYIYENCRGLPPILTDNKILEEHPGLRNKIKRAGGIKYVCKFLGPTPRELAPFAAVFASAKINAESIPLLKLSDKKKSGRSGFARLDWEKERAGGEIEGHDWPIGGEAARTVIRAFLALEEITENFRHFSTKKDALFISYTGFGGIKNNKNLVETPGKGLSQSFVNLRRDFLSLNPDWCGLDGEHPNIQVENIRATAINVLHQDLSFETDDTRRAIYHKEWGTTANYLKHPEHRNLRQSHIRASQDLMVEWVREGAITILEPTTTSVARELSSSVEVAGDWINNSLNAVGNGFQCKSPLNSLMPGQKKGKICSFFIGFFSCVNSMVIATPFNIARMILWTHHLEAAKSRLLSLNSLRWGLIYEPQIQTLKSALADMPPKQLVAGRSLAEKINIKFPTVD